MLDSFLGSPGTSQAVSILSFCRTLSLLLTNVFFVKPWEIIFPLPHIGGNTRLAHDFLMGFSCPNCSSFSCILEPAMSLQMRGTPLSPALPPFLSSLQPEWTPTRVLYLRKPVSKMFPQAAKRHIDGDSRVQSHILRKSTSSRDLCPHKLLANSGCGPEPT